MSNYISDDLRRLADDWNTPERLADKFAETADVFDEMAEALKLAVAGHEDPAIWLADARAAIEKLKPPVA